MSQETISAAEFRAMQKPTRAGTVTGPGGRSSSPRPRPEPAADAEGRGESGTILRPSESAKREWNRRWKAGESVALVRYHHAGRTRWLCVDAEGWERVRARAHRVVSHCIDVYTEPAA